MDSHSHITIGFVPSLEAIPFVTEMSENDAYRMVPCPSYGRIIRRLLEGRLMAGLLPFEIFLIEILSRPSLIERWCVPMVLPAAPIELVMRRRIMKNIQQAEQGEQVPPVKTITIGVESRTSLTRHQFISWQQAHKAIQASKIVFKMLPMELMQKAMLAGTIDGFLAPTPWGLAAASIVECSLVGDFTPDKLAQELVFCCNRNMMEGLTNDLRMMPEKLRLRRYLCTNDVEARDKAIAIMETLGRPVCNAEALSKSSELYSQNISNEEMIPDGQWLAKQIERTARLVPSVSRSGFLQLAAESLVFATQPDNLAQATTSNVLGLVGH